MKKNLLITFLLTTVIFLSSCNSTRVNSRNPVTISLWHNYGGQLKDTFDEMIDKFNETVGTKEGIIINVTSISSSSALHEKLAMIANEEPGAPQLPDITTAYPKTAIILAQKGLLTDLNEEFSPDELSHYIPEFLEEGRINGDELYVFPIAKSTEVMFLNTTIFQRFSKDTGADIKDLESVEGLVKTAKLYYEWTDKQTPEIKNDGKMFFMPDSLFNFSLIGCKQLGVDLIKNGKIDLSSPEYKKIWEAYYKPAVLGQIAIFDGYATDLARTGDIVCSTGSTAGISYFSPTVTYGDNTTEPSNITILPYPVFEGATNIAIQRGGGMIVTKSTEEKERAAGTFLKWFTSPENNLHFISATGYLPVTTEAFEDIMSIEIDSTSDSRIKPLLRTAKEMNDKYTFIIPPLFEEIDQVQKSYENKLKSVTNESRNKYIRLIESVDSAYETATEGVFDGFIRDFSIE